MLDKLVFCRVCGSDDLVDVVDLGKIFPSGFLKEDEKLSEDVKIPMVACRCENCGLVQLRYTLELDRMYRQYWYASSLNRSMVSSLHEIVEEIEKRVDIADTDYVVDIGANDGTMLQMYNNGIKIGFDPALNLHKPSCNVFVNDYFTADAYWKVASKKAKVITAIAMYYDLPDPVKFTREVADILADDGIFVVQLTDLLAMFQLTAYDSFCTEHLEYYTLQDIVNIFNAADLKVIDVSYNDVNGGSVRVTAVHRYNKTRPSDRAVGALVSETEYFDSHDFAFFNNNINSTKLAVSEFLSWAKEAGKTVHLLGASTKGNTLLQHCGITNKYIPYAAEVNADKFGMRTAGSDIEIISEDDSLAMKPDYMFCPIWHFRKGILKNPKIQDYLKSGGRLVFPLPKFSIVSSSGEDLI